MIMYKTVEEGLLQLAYTGVGVQSAVLLVSRPDLHNECTIALAFDANPQCFVIAESTHDGVVRHDLPFMAWAAKQPKAPRFYPPVPEPKPAPQTEDELRALIRREIREEGLKAAREMDELRAKIEQRTNDLINKDF